MSFSLNPLARHRRRCAEVRGQMSAYLDGELDEAKARSVERHTRWCPNCRRMLANLRATLAGLHRLRDAAEPLE